MGEAKGMRERGKVGRCEGKGGLGGMIDILTYNRIFSLVTTAIAYGKLMPISRGSNVEIPIYI